MSNFGSHIKIDRFNRSHIKLCNVLTDFTGLLEEDDDFTLEITTFKIVDVVLIGGGGGGGAAGNENGDAAGGGGAGGVIVIPDVPLLAGTYGVKIGLGGDGSSHPVGGTIGQDGGDTVFRRINKDGSVNDNHIKITAIGGGGGGGADAHNGGSGGGGGNALSFGTGEGGVTASGQNEKDQGNNGGDGSGEFGDHTGGGGGAGSEGKRGDDNGDYDGGDGGEGIISLSDYGDVGFTLPDIMAAGGGGAGKNPGSGGNSIGGGGALINFHDDVIEPPTPPSGIGCGGGGSGAVEIGGELVHYDATGGTSGYGMVNVRNINAGFIHFNNFDKGEKPDIDIITVSDWVVSDSIMGSQGNVLTSGEVDNGDVSIVEFEIDVGGEGIIAFSYFYSLHTDDNFRVLIDGGEIINKSGQADDLEFWYEENVSSGIHHVEFRAEKGTPEISGLNQGFIDTFAFTI